MENEESEEKKDPQKRGVIIGRFEITAHEHAGFSPKLYIFGHLIRLLHIDIDIDIIARLCIGKIEKYVKATLRAKHEAFGNQPSRRIGWPKLDPRPTVAFYWASPCSSPG